MSQFFLTFWSCAQLKGFAQPSLLREHLQQIDDNHNCSTFFAKDTILMKNVQPWLNSNRFNILSFFSKISL